MVSLVFPSCRAPSHSRLPLDSYPGRPLTSYSHRADTYVITLEKLFSILSAPLFTLQGLLHSGTIESTLPSRSPRINSVDPFLVVHGLGGDFLRFVFFLHPSFVFLLCLLLYFLFFIVRTPAFSLMPFFWHFFFFIFPGCLLLCLLNFVPNWPRNHFSPLLFRSARRHLWKRRPVSLSLSL